MEYLKEKKRLCAASTPYKSAADKHNNDNYVNNKRITIITIAMIIERLLINQSNKKDSNLINFKCDISNFHVGVGNSRKLLLESQRSTNMNFKTTI